MGYGSGRIRLRPLRRSRKPYASDIRRQAVQIERLAVFGGGHQFFRACPVLMLGVLCQKFFLKSIYASLVALRIEFGSLFHCRKRSPTLWIDDIGIFGRLLPYCWSWYKSRRISLRFPPPQPSTSGNTSYPSGCASTTSIPNRVISPMTPCGTESGFP